MCAKLFMSDILGGYLEVFVWTVFGVSGLMDIWIMESRKRKILWEEKSVHICLYIVLRFRVGERWC